MSDAATDQTISIPETPSPQTLEEILAKARAALAVMTELAESARAAAAASVESQKQTSGICADVQNRLAEVTAVVSQAAAARTQISDEQSVIAVKSDHIQKAQEHADKVRADLDRALTAGTQQVTEAEGLKVRAQSAADTATTLMTSLRTTKGAVETDATAIGLARKTAEEAAGVAKGLADRSSKVETSLSAYESRLAELTEACGTQLKTIESLLPGATSAGLAHAFDERRKSFLKPHNLWQWIFVGSVSAIVLLAASGLWHVFRDGPPPTYDELVRLWLSRLPVAGALVWLALYASRESALAKRLEEDYGFKSAIASCFEGFRKQMLEVGAGLPPDSPLAKLSANTLSTIATPPGRIYDRHALIVSPAAELQQAAKAVAETVRPLHPNVT